MSATVQDIQEIQAYSCMGTTCYRFNEITKMARVVYTDGVKSVMDKAGAYWLLNDICLYQPRVQKILGQDIQFWKLIVEDSSARLICERDTDDVIFSTDIEYTDFPEMEFRIWLELSETSFGDGPVPVMVAMLPEER